MSDITRVDSENRINQLYTQENEAVETKKETTTKEVVQQPAVEEKVETVAQEAIQKAALPAVKLKSITHKDVEKKDKALVSAHIPSRIKNAKWDAARNVVVIVKSGKTRAYQIGHGARPALIESKKSSDVTAYLNRM